MNPRTIRIMAAFNVVTAALLFIWFMTLPQQSNLGAIFQEVVDTSSEVDASIRLEYTQLIRDGWQYRAQQYSYWALAAGAVVMWNAAFFLFHLLCIGAGESPVKHSQQLTGDARVGE